jgi:hypothetical protein
VIEYGQHCKPALSDHNRLPASDGLNHRSADKTRPVLPVVTDRTVFAQIAPAKQKSGPHCPSSNFTQSLLTAVGWTNLRAGGML